MRLLLFIMLALASAAAQQATTPTPRISGGVMEALVLTKVPPVYPQAARDAHVSGSVVLHAVVSSEGLVKGLTVVSGPAMLREAAMDAVEQWTYKPYLLNGRPTDVDTTITVNFQYLDAVQGGVPGGTGPVRSALPPLPAGRVRISSGVMARQKISGDLPNLCAIGKETRSNGQVLMRVVIDRTGTVSDALWVSGPAIFQMASINAVRQWKYKPYLLNGEPVEVETTIAFGESCGG